MRPVLFLILFGCSLSFIHAQPTQVHAVYYGAPVEAAKLGFNARVVNNIDAEDCTFPETLQFGHDWRSIAFRDSIAQLRPQILRFPGGTNANYWFWSSEERMVVNSDGVPDSLTICEGAFIDVDYSIDMGCEGPTQFLYKEVWDTIHTRTSTRLADFLESVQELRVLKGQEVEEMYVLSITDPFYYVGSPQLNYEWGHLTPENQRTKLGMMGVKRAVKQLNILLQSYCGDCTSYDEPLLFEIGNEPFLMRYGKFFPDLECMTSDTPCDCRPDINFYVDLCKALIPHIEQRFPNAKICVAGGRFKVAQKFWNQRLVDEFGPGSDNEIDAVNVHFYPWPLLASSVDTSECDGTTLPLDAEKVLAQHQYSISQTMFRRGLQDLSDTGWEVWFTEFNLGNDSRDCVDNGEAKNYYAGNWTHVLSVLAQLHALTTLKLNAKIPWLKQPFFMDVTKLCVHNLYGTMLGATLDNELDIRSTGMAVQLFQTLNAHASQLQPIAVLAELPTALQGVAQPELSADDLPNAPFLTYALPDEDLDPGDEDFLSHLAFGLSFKSDTSYGALLVNLSSTPLSVALGSLHDLPSIASAKTIHVPTDSLFIRFRDGWAEPSIIHTNVQELSDVLVIPPFGIATLTGNPEPPLPCPSFVAQQAEVPVTCGSGGCDPCDCSFTSHSTATFEENSGIWNMNSDGQPAAPFAIPSVFQATAPFLGQRALRLFSSMQPLIDITSPVVDASALTAIGIKFHFAATGMSNPDDRLILGYSTDGGSSFQPLTIWRHGVHFENGMLYQAAFSIDVPSSNATQIRLRAASSEGPGKVFFIDNLELLYCGAPTEGLHEVGHPDVAPASMAPALSASIAPNPAKDETLLYIYSAASGANVEVSLHDLMGRVINGWTLPRSTSGEHVKRIKTEMLSRGLYLLVINSGSEQKTLKLQKM